MLVARVEGAVEQAAQRTRCGAVVDGGAYDKAVGIVDGIDELVGLVVEDAAADTAAASSIDAVLDGL